MLGNTTAVLQPTNNEITISVQIANVTEYSRLPIIGFNLLISPPKLRNIYPFGRVTALWGEVYLLIVFFGRHNMGGMYVLFSFGFLSACAPEPLKGRQREARGCGSVEVL